MITASVEQIGPAEAQALLALNTKNRGISHRTVSAFARDMQAGNWSLNGESVKVTGSERLIDGQHRLLAVVESGATVSLLVVRGLDDNAQDTIDIGLRRRFADVLALDGEANAHNLAAAARTGWYMDNFSRPRASHMIVTTPELQTWLGENPQIREWLHMGWNISQSAVRYIPSLATALGYLMGRKSVTQSLLFWEQLQNGADIKQGDPTFALRETLLRDLSAARRMSATDRAAITIKMWNAMRDGKNVSFAYWRGEGPKAEAFPQIK